MSIEQNYLSKINAIEQSTALTDFEKKFIFGDDQGRPIKQRESLSDKQKAMIDRIYKERVEGLNREAAATISFGNPRVSAIQVNGNKTYQVVVDNNQVGPIVNFGEATNVVSWISQVLKDNQLSVTLPEGAASAPAKFPGE